MHHSATVMCTYELQNCALWDKGMVHCGICGTGLLLFPAGVNKGVHLTLLLKYRDHNMKVVLPMFSFTFSGNNRLIYRFKFHSIASKKLLANLGLVKGDMSLPWWVMATKTKITLVLLLLKVLWNTFISSSFSIISQHWDGTGSWEGKDRSILYCCFIKSSPA